MRSNCRDVILFLMESKIRVGVLRGGPSSEYDVSLKSGSTVLKNLPSRYAPIDIFISKDGEWHQGGIVRSPDKIFSNVDVIFNALHGEYGEDGGVQKILDAHQIPYTGSGTVASALAMNKILTKERLKKEGVKIPLHVVAKTGDDVGEKVEEVFRSFSPPYVVKPVSLGSSVGVIIVKTIFDLVEALAEASELTDTILIEEGILGREATCGVINHFRGEHIYPLLPIEILPPEKNGFYDYDAKYVSNDTRYMLPGNFSADEKKTIQDVSALAHDILGLRHYSRSDFIVSPRRGVYFLEVNTLPGLTDHSLVPKSLDAIGCSLPQFFDHLLTLAMERR